MGDVAWMRGGNCMPQTQRILWGRLCVGSRGKWLLGQGECTHQVLTQYSQPLLFWVFSLPLLPQSQFEKSVRRRKTRANPFCGYTGLDQLKPIPECHQQCLFHVCGIERGGTRYLSAQVPPCGAAPAACRLSDAPRYFLLSFTSLVKP